MLRFKYIEMRNFLSFGNVPQRVELNGSTLTLIMGVNNDSTSDENGDETRNGVGKSSVMQALNFVLFGKSIDNRIKLTNLVNKTNKKNCEVTVEFEKDGVDYKIIRSRSPTNVQFYVNDTKIVDPDGEAIEGDDEAQGENRATQQVIQEVIGMTQEMFTQIITLSTSDDPFLAKGASKQRQIIEELLTITQLSEKAEKLKELVKSTKDAIDREKFRCETVEASNGKILETIKGFERQSLNWEGRKQSDIQKVQTLLDNQPEVNVEECVTQMEQRDIAIKHNQRVRDLNAKFDKLVLSATKFNDDADKSVAKLNAQIDELRQIDIDVELQAHADIESWNKRKMAQDAQIAESKLLNSTMTALSSKILKCDQTIARLQTQIVNSTGAKCPTCNSELEHEKHLEIVGKIQQSIDDEVKAQNDYNQELADLQTKMDDLASNEIPEVGNKPVTHYKNVADAYKHQANIVALENEIKAIEALENKDLTEALRIQTELESSQIVEEIELPFIDYDDLYTYTSIRDKNVQRLETLIAQENPYIAQINTLRESSLQHINYDELNRLRKMQEHQEFLVKLLTNKNSFVRKRIIDQNLSFLNSRLAHYITKSGSPHVVTFLNDLSVDITHMGNNYDYDNLSRGEKTRVVIALTLAFRDTFESLNFAVNTLMIDELLDNGVDAAGCNAGYHMLKDIAEAGKNIFLVTHRPELQAKCENIMYITKENGFSSIDISDNE